MAANRVWGAFWSCNLSSVIIFQVYTDGIAFGPPECDPPVCAGVDRITAFAAADERMKAEARQVHSSGCDASSGDVRGNRSSRDRCVRKLAGPLTARPRLLL